MKTQYQVRINGCYACTFEQVEDAWEYCKQVNGAFPQAKLDIIKVVF